MTAPAFHSSAMKALTAGSVFNTLENRPGYRPRIAPSFLGQERFEALLQ
jgi:hypothetical protein